MGDGGTESGPPSASGLSTIQALEGQHEHVLQMQSVNIVWVMFCSFLVISMQLGFAMLEVGSCRAAHRMTVLVKNVLDSAVSCVGFYAVGAQNFGSLLVDDSGSPQHHLTFFYWGFCATAVTICSGSLAERAHMFAYICYAFVMSAVIFPALSEGAWGLPGSKLYNQFHGHFGHDYHDFAGSGVVHLAGGVAALTGNMLLGRRVMRPDGSIGHHALGSFGSASERNTNEGKQNQLKDLEGLSEHGDLEPVLCPEAGWTRRFDNVDRDTVELKKCNYLQAMGMFTLWVGWYGFNAGSTLFLENGGVAVAAAVAWNTSLAAAGGGCGAFVYCYCIRKVLDVGLICNGIISGLVAITGSCDVATESTALLIGLAAGLFIFPLASYALAIMRIDDPVDAIPVHFACGLFGTLAVAFCVPNCNRWELAIKDVPEGGPRHAWERFCSAEHTIGLQLLAQAWGAFVEFGIVAVVCLLLFGSFAVSEYARAVEAGYLKHADRLLCDMAAGIPQTSVESEWVELSKNSPTVRELISQDGWTGQGFQDGAPKDVWSLRTALRQARGKKFETALEGEGCWWHPVAFLGRKIGFTWLVRNVAIIRFRISPAAEVSGLGAADNEENMMRAVMKAVHSPIKNYEQKTSQEYTEIENQVRELSAIVTSQDRLLRDLIDRRNIRRHCPSESRMELLQQPRQLHDVPEEDENALNTPPQPTPPPGAASSTSAVPVETHHVSSTTSQAQSATSTASASQNFPEAPPSGADTPTQQMRTPGVFRGFSTSRRGPRSHASTNTDASTVSDRSAGAITPLSEIDSTPPPSLIGHARLGNNRPLRNLRSTNSNNTALNDLAAAARQIAQALESQQQMLANFQNIPRSMSSVSGSIAGTSQVDEESGGGLPRGPLSVSSQSSRTEEERPQQWPPPQRIGHEARYHF